MPAFYSRASIIALVGGLLSAHVARAAGTTVAGLHTAGFSPDREPTIRTGVTTLTLSVLELLGKPR